MTLAIILVVSISSAWIRAAVSAPAASRGAEASALSQSGPSQSGPSQFGPPQLASAQSGSEPSSSAQTQTGGSSQGSSNTPAPIPASQQTSESKKPAGAQHPTHKAKATASDCVSAAAPENSKAPESPQSSPTAQNPASPGTASNSPPAKAATVCPPAKVIVRQGGTAQPSIELAGGAVGDQAAQQKHTANEMLQAAEENLKKIDGRQLAVNQQDMVDQIHQFMVQSKTAVAAGDLERGRTLAWKAQLLSEELANPQK
jgi:hypothetical protein